MTKCAARIWNTDSDKQKFADQLDAMPITTVGRNPVAVPEKIIGLTLILDFFDRCHSLVFLPPPQAAVDSLPTGRAETHRTGNQLRRGRIHPARDTSEIKCTTTQRRRGDYQSPVALPTGYATTTDQ